MSRILRKILVKLMVEALIYYGIQLYLTALHLRLLVENRL